MTLIIRLFFVVLLAAPFSAFGQRERLERKINVVFGGETLAEALDILEQKAAITFTYRADQFPNRTVQKNYENISVRKVLDDLLRPAGMRYKIRGRMVLVYPENEKPQVAAPPQYVLSGYVEDREYGERLAGARVFDVRSGLGTLTNEQGYFSFTLPRDSVKLVVSMLGYAVYGERLYLSKDARRRIRLLSDLELETVEINDQDNYGLDDLAGANVVYISSSDLDRLPGLMGEPGMLANFDMFPGVQNTGDAANGLYVRGGGPDQNLVLVDGVPLYNSSHLFSFYSIFNSAAIKQMNLVKGGFPAQYGGRLSSVVDIKLKDGDAQKLHGQGNIGLTAAELMFEGPIIKGKTTFVLSGRRTILEPYWWAFNRFAANVDGNNIGYSFYELNGKVQHRLSPRDRLSLTFTSGEDDFSAGYNVSSSGVEDDFESGQRWGNTAAILSWNREWSKRVFGELSVYGTQYRFRSESTSELNWQDNDASAHALSIASGVKDYGGKLNFDILPGSRHFIKVGGAMVQHKFQPEAFNQTTTTNSTDTTQSRQQAALFSWEASAYIQDNFEVTRRLRINAGLHFSAFLTGNTTYNSLQPRISARYMLPWDIDFSGSFSTMVQYVHLLSNSGVGLPTDLWVPATENIPPQRAVQYSAGLRKSFQNAGLILSLEGYYKTLSDMITYQNGVNFIGNRDWEDLVERNGTGQSYGLEFLLRRTTGRLRGWLGYTLSRTERQFATINAGDPFPYKYDRRHDLSLALIYRIGENMEFEADWNYGTGAAITFPEGVYFAPSSPVLGFWDLNERPGLGVVINYGERNSFRLPAYHRLDLKFRLRKAVRWGELFWQVGVYNVYNRQNPFFLFLRADYSQNPSIPDIKARRMSLLPILPELNFGFKF